MPFYYDMNCSISTNGTPATETTHIWGTTAANQETVSILGVYASARSLTAGGASLRVKHNTGTIASGGTVTAFPVNPKNLRGNPAAQSTWKFDNVGGSAITPGATLVKRLSVGFAQTGGMGGYVPITQQDAIQMMPNATNPVDVEITSIAVSASILGDVTVEIGEGV